MTTHNCKPGRYDQPLPHTPLSRSQTQPSRGLMTPGRGEPASPPGTINASRTNRDTGRSDQRGGRFHVRAPDKIGPTTTKSDANTTRSPSMPPKRTPTC